ncbi:thioredoxin family protein [Agromyces archimandritae]|uniref:Thioredoxin family protein n=1 Tax=Agromyces archimandritae TaxID=2781962 RepID=A0A975FMW0_9MICO|nr:thioredoxin family protein [Agromyces archimandritae]QTX05065.1 thioredoxin family protein [Agromyces archimandritae]
MATVALTLENFEQTILEGGTVFVDFWASWCGPCVQFAPNYEAASEANPDAVFAKVDTEDQQQLAAAMNITSIPTIMAFKDGIGVFAQAGALPRPVLDDLIEQVKGLDMDEVRRQMAAEQETADAVESSEVTED